MTKKDIHAQNAENLYVVHQRTLKDIAINLGLSYKTVYNWSKEGDWETKRASACSSTGNAHGDLMEMAKGMLRQMQIDQQAGKEIDLDRFYALSKMIESASKSLKYEKEAPAETKDKLSQEEQSRRFGKKLREILGI